MRLSTRPAKKETTNSRISSIVPNFAVCSLNGDGRSNATASM
jgi:hypothetical protein